MTTLFRIKNMETQIKTNKKVGIGDASQIPSPHDLAAWQEYKGPYCRWMIDTESPAPGSCQCHWVECTNPESPISKPMPNGKKMPWKTRFCHPEMCRFFEF